MTVGALLSRALLVAVFAALSSEPGLVVGEVARDAARDLVQAAGSAEEASLLEAVVERPTDPAPFVALANFYYKARRLELAVRTLTAALAVARAEATRPVPPPPAPGVLRAGIEVPLPAKTRDVLPRPNQGAIEAGAEGVVVVEVVIDEEGRVSQPRVVQPVPLLNESAVEAVSGWRFQPVLSAGRPARVAALLAVDVTYRTEPEPDRDLELAAVYLRGYLYSQAEPLMARALAAIGRELECFGSDLEVSRRARVGQPQRGGGGAGGAAVVTQPEKIQDVRPRYPQAAQEARIEGMVILEALLSRQGSVRCLRVLRSVPILDQPSLDAVRQWRFRPSEINGVPVEVTMTVTVRFSLRVPAYPLP